MPDFITLTCPTCGGKLQITDKISTFACGHCGNEHVVRREGGMIYLAPLAQDVRQIRVGVDKTAAELAVARLTKEVSDLNAALQAAEQRQINDWIPRGQWEDGWRAFAIIFTVLALIVMGNSTGLGVFLFVVSFVLIVVILRIDAIRVKSAHAKRDAEIRRLQALLNERAAALMTNRRIAES